MTTEEANDIIYRYYYDVLKFCGCYKPEQVLEELEAALERIDAFTRTRGKREQFEQALKPHLEWVDTHLILVYLLDALQLTEHGYNLSSAWLTPKGEKLLEALRASDDDWSECQYRTEDIDAEKRLF